jgi:general secretion pathway protein M
MELREWFERLAPRERILVMVAGALLIIAVVVIGALRPLAVGRQRAAEQLADKRAVLADIERVATRFGPQSPGATAAQPSGESLVVLVDRMTRSRGLAPYLKRNEPDGASSIRLRFENAPFDELVGWLVEMQVSQGIAVVNATADPARDAGRVSANLQLSRAPPRG